MPLKKSFSFKSSDANNKKKKLVPNSVEEEPPTTNLNRQFSISPNLIRELQSHQLFQQRKHSIGNRVSRSFDDVITIGIEDHVRYGHQSGQAGQFNTLGQRKSTSLSGLKSIEELLKSFNDTPKSSRGRRPPFDVGRFPIALEEDDSSSSRGRSDRLGSGSTVEFEQIRRKPPHRSTNLKNFELRGVIKIQGPGGKIDLFKVKEDCLMYEDGSICRVNGKAKTKNILYPDVSIKSIRLRDRRQPTEVEVRDVKSNIYIFYFDQSKKAKEFVDSDKVQTYYNNTSKVTLVQTLRRLLGVRASRDALEQRGIYKNEPIFGNTLRDIALATGDPVPAFVTDTVRLLERPGNIKSMGLYRTSGNLATIQKVRLEVDNGKLTVLERYQDDPDVLTGSLKLFFRELKEPLIAESVCHRILQITKDIDINQLTPDDHLRISNSLILSLEDANLETFRIILKHLLNVIQYKEHNKMDSYNLAICWGPSLVFPAARASNNLPFELPSDIVSLSQDATRMVDFFLVYYSLYPAELDNLSQRHRSESFSSYTLRSDRSDISSVSYRSSRPKSESSVGVDEVVRILVDAIDSHVGREDLYLSRGSTDRTAKIGSRIRKFHKKKLSSELRDIHKDGPNELADSLKNYIHTCDCLVPDQTVERILNLVPGTPPEHFGVTTRHVIGAEIETTPKGATFIYLLRHLAKVARQFDDSKKSQFCTIWAKVLHKENESRIPKNEFEKFLQLTIGVFDENNSLPDVVRSSFDSGNRENMDELIREFSQQSCGNERDRNSRYDNVDSETEDNFLDEKTEETKL